MQSDRQKGYYSRWQIIFGLSSLFGPILLSLVTVALIGSYIISFLESPRPEFLWAFIPIKEFPLLLVGGSCLCSLICVIQKEKKWVFLGLIWIMAGLIFLIVWTKQNPIPWD